MSYGHDDLDRRIAAQLALRESVAAYEHARASLHTAQVARDRLIRDCLDLGVRAVDVRAIAHISHTRLSQIRREHHDDETP